jgi:hypothetical protein
MRLRRAPCCAERRCPRAAGVGRRAACVERRVAGGVAAADCTAPDRYATRLRRTRDLERARQRFGRCARTVRSDALRWLPVQRVRRQRRGIAALRVEDGPPTAWDPHPELLSFDPPWVAALTVSGPTVYAGCRPCQNLPAPVAARTDRLAGDAPPPDRPGTYVVKSLYKSSGERDAWKSSACCRGRCGARRNVLVGV